MHCIECGIETLQLYKTYPSGNKILKMCDSCNKTVDKYIEFSTNVVLLDILLQKHQVYRHLIYNSNAKGIQRKITDRKLLISLLAYSIELHLHSTKASQFNSSSIMSLLKMSIVFDRLLKTSLDKAVCDILYWLGILIGDRVYCRLKKKKKLSIKVFGNAILFSTYTKLLLFPLLLFKTDNFIQKTMILMLGIFSSIEAYTSVTFDCYMRSIFAAFIGIFTFSLFLGGKQLLKWVRLFE
eukprot:GHVP01062274.1.p1 GENE.GHVP01062274.1~~GHVP01062274.1.p1  ORF type:complete len:239 (+),score=21.80 GHVP01062274.1:309-1025(+)